MSHDISPARKYVWSVKIFFNLVQFEDLIGFVKWVMNWVVSFLANRSSEELFKMYEFLKAKRAWRNMVARNISRTPPIKGSTFNVRSKCIRWHAGQFFAWINDHFRLFSFLFYYKLPRKYLWHFLIFWKTFKGCSHIIENLNDKAIMFLSPRLSLRTVWTNAVILVMFQHMNLRGHRYSVYMCVCVCVCIVSIWIKGETEKMFYS